VSVHGANRLGSNSLLDLVVFGRAARATLRARPSSRRRQPAAEGRRRLALAASTGCAMPRAARRPRAAPRHAAAMQNDAPCSAPASRCRRASSARRVFASVRRRRVRTAALVWNTDLIETLELDNLLGRRWSPSLGGQPQGKPRRACARGLPERDDENWMKHTLPGSTSAGAGEDRLPPGAHVHADQRRRSVPAEGAVY
jgi:succinate dehydrogenase / fumarate reductase flavoprotein subunit